MTSTSAPSIALAEAAAARTRLAERRQSKNRYVHVFLIVMAALWLFPLAWAIYQSFRTYGDTAANPVILASAVSRSWKTWR